MKQYLICKIEYIEYNIKYYDIVKKYIEYNVKYIHIEIKYRTIKENTKQTIIKRKYNIKSLKNMIQYNEIPDNINI